MPPSTSEFLWLVSVLAILFISLIAFLNFRIPGFPAARKAKPAATAPRSPAESILRVVQLRYENGDWNANPDSPRNLLNFYQLNHSRDADIRTELFFGMNGRDLDPRRHHFVYATGHADFRLEPEDLRGLLAYTAGGGVVLIEDNNGLDFYFRLFVEKTLPGYTFEVVRAHRLFREPFAMPEHRFPKIMKHGNRPAELLRLVNGKDKPDFFYSYSSDLGDGWENPGAHNLREEKRLLALRMGANFLDYALGKTRGS